MKLEQLIAVRYLFARRQKSVVNIISWISLIGLLVSTAALIVVLSVYNGIGEITRGLFGSFDPELVVEPAEGKTFRTSDIDYGALCRADGVQQVAQTVSETAWLTYGEQQAIVTLRGVDEAYRSVSGLDTMLHDGSYALTIGDAPALIVGGEIYYNLGMRLLSNRPAAVHIPKRGTTALGYTMDQAFNIGYAHPTACFFIQQDIDRRYVVTHIDFVRQLMDYAPDEVTALAVKLRPGANPQKVKQALNSKLKTQNSNYVVILDADNIVAPNFLSQLSRIARPDIAIQCHRTAKNADNDIAALDGLSEEINNSIFRKGHNRIGMSSALIGSGMCFNYEWFKNHVCMLESAVEDRELEALLMKQGIYIHYAEDIKVMDEKVSNSDNFQRQRLRWMTGQVQAFFHMLTYVPKAIITANINYIDKTIQQALIPRSILLVLTPLLAVFSSVYALLTTHYSLFIIQWWTLYAMLMAAIFVAIPAPIRTSALFSKIATIPKLVWKMVLNIQKIDHKNTTFIHTTHDKK